MKLGRIVIVAFVAMILSGPATAAVAQDGRSGGDVLELAREQLAKVVTELS